MRALSSTERPCASSSSSPASSESWLGTGSTNTAYTTPSSPISLAALRSAVALTSPPHNGCRLANLAIELRVLLTDQHPRSRMFAFDQLRGRGT